ncbi:cyclin-Y-like protein 2 isoform X4 [Sapajus apella]|uniref:Cyclin-Y-like protein 2 isoform X4 n=1 Tax=Sapajus apella TaxID=9515 RepID=A0A6J3GAQ7_SAPAP|nr:cyclin-Y-like protein 2 isoform X4 [Sapajus apella]
MPEDRALESNPSDHPEAKKSEADAQEIEENSGTNHIDTYYFSSKFNSCSTIFLEDTTTSCPHFKMTLKSVALEIYLLIKERDENRTLEIFDEHIFPFNVSGTFIEVVFLS